MILYGTSTEAPPVVTGVGNTLIGMRQLWRFGYQEAASCVFAGAVFGLLAVTSVVPLPIARYDALLIGCLVLTGLLWALRVETGREVLVIGLFHLVGLALELFKVRTGSWTYPGEAFSKIGGVPLYSGFMYAAVGSYMCQPGGGWICG